MKTLSILLFLFSPLSWLPATFGASADGHNTHALYSRVSAFSFEGVPIDYSYNETAHNSTHFVSVPGCPKSINGFPWVMFKDENGTRCYLTGKVADVCNFQHVMHARLESKLGICSRDFTGCVDNGGTVSHGGRYTFCSPHLTFCDELVYDDVEKTTYEMYRQGPCMENEWLSRDGVGGIECRPRLCPGGNDRISGDDEKRYFANKYISADDVFCCRPSYAHSYAPGNIYDGNCPPGKVLDPFLSRCRTSFGKSSLVIG